MVYELIKLLDNPGNPVSDLRFKKYGDTFYRRRAISEKNLNQIIMKNWREKGRMIRSKEKEKQAGRKTATGQFTTVKQTE